MRTPAVLLSAIMVVGPATQPSDLKKGEVLVRVETALGHIDLAIDVKRAPITAENFLKYVDGGFLRLAAAFIVRREQTTTSRTCRTGRSWNHPGRYQPGARRRGVPADSARAHQRHGPEARRWTVSMARGAVDSARSGFFILLNDQPSLDYGGLRFDDGQGGAAFGRVVAGMSVVRAIQQQPVKDQNLTPPIVITKVYRVR